MIFDIKVGTDKYKVQKLEPALFLSDTDGIPFNIFQFKTDKTMYEKLLEDTKSDTNPKNDVLYNNFKIILERSIISVNNEAFDCHKFLNTQTDLDYVQDLINKILDVSLIKFKEVINLNKNQILVWDNMAKRYSKTPIECLFPEGGYSNLDAYFFNLLILIEGNKEDARLKKMELNNLKKGSKR